MRGLWDDKDKLVEVIALVISTKLIGDALAKLICRGLYSPKKSKGDPPGPNQKPDKGGDGGGPDGDTGPGSGAGEAAAVGGTAASEAAAEAGAVAETLAWFVLGSFGVTWVSKNPPPSPPQPGGTPKPLDDDIYGKVIYDLINKDFDRWRGCDEYSEAASTALDCALEYQAAIRVLRKVLASDTTAPLLGEKVFDDYTGRCKVLVHDFSLLSRQFADRWLDMSGQEIKTDLLDSRKLLIKFTSLRLDQSLATAATVFINGREIRTEASSSFTVNIPAYDISHDLEVRIEVTAMAALWDDDQTYVFYSQGKPATARYMEWAPHITALDVNTYFPNPPYLLTSDNEKVEPNAYPALRIGPYTYWRTYASISSLMLMLIWTLNCISAFTYGYYGYTSGVVAQTQDGRTVRIWDSDAPYIYKIELNADKSVVTLTGWYISSPWPEPMDMQDLLIDPHPTCWVTTSNARDQPSPPDSRYVYAAKDHSQYPVLILGSYTLWREFFTCVALLHC